MKKLQNFDCGRWNGFMPGITYRMFRALSDEKINILAISTSEIKLSVLIEEINTLKAIKKLHTVLTWIKMDVRPYRKIIRKNTKEIKVGKVSIGGNSVISVQSMTNTLTTDTKATINQIHKLEKAGADIVRVSCPDEDSSKALKNIVKEVSVPIVADIHFHYKRAVEAAEMGASCLRINPGNIGSNDRILEIVKAAKIIIVHSYWG